MISEIIGTYFDIWYCPTWDLVIPFATFIFAFGFILYIVFK